MADKQYYWVDSASNFGAGDSAITYGGKMPKNFKSEDERFQSFLDSGLISTEKTAGKAELSELESLREENKVLKGDISEQKKSSKGEGGPSQADFDALVKERDQLAEDLEAATAPKANK